MVDGKCGVLGFPRGGAGDNLVASFSSASGLDGSDGGWYNMGGARNGTPLCFVPDYEPGSKET